MKLLRKFFFYDNEVISGTTYLLRITVPAFILFISMSSNNYFFIIPAILLLSYIQSVIAYKRAKSISKLNFVHISFAIWGLIVFPIQFFVASQGASSVFDGMNGFLIIVFPNLILLFSNRSKNIN